MIVSWLMVLINKLVVISFMNVFSQMGMLIQLLNGMQKTLFKSARETMVKSLSIPFHELRLIMGKGWSK